MIESVAAAETDTAPPQHAAARRLHWIDSLKAFGIFLVVYGHSGATGWGIGKWIFSFHMPLFFLLSGYLLRTTSPDSSFFGFAARGARSLLPAYATFGVVGYVAWVFVLRHFGDSTRDAAPAFFPVLAFFYGTGTPTLFSVVPVVLWFFPCLFTSHLIVYLIHCRDRRWQSLISGLLAIAGFAVPPWLALPMELETALVAQWFVFWGHQLKTRNHWLDAFSSSAWSSLYPLALGTACALLNDRVDMRTSEFGNPLLFLGSATLIPVGLVALARKVPSNRVLETMARNTIVLFPLHPLVFSLFAGVYVVLNHPLSTRSNPWVGILASIVNTALLLLAAPLIARFLPWVYGLKRSRRVGSGSALVPVLRGARSQTPLANGDPPVAR